MKATIEIEMGEETCVENGKFCPFLATMGGRQVCFHFVYHSVPTTLRDSDKTGNVTTGWPSPPQRCPECLAKWPVPEEYPIQDDPRR